MTTDVATNDRAAPLLYGVLIGVLTFLGLMIWFGLPIIPTVDDLPTVMKDKPSPYPVVVATGPTDPGERVYQTVCVTCHQATGQGVAGAFPPLAGSEWVNGDPETVIRIVIAGLSGPVQVKGQTFNALMPPPPGLDDEKIADVITFVRSRFGNKSSKVEKAQVAAVRAQLAGRSKPWTADELKALQQPAGEPAAAGSDKPGAEKPAGDSAPPKAAP